MIKKALLRLDDAPLTDEELYLSERWNEESARKEIQFVLYNGRTREYKAE